MTWSQTSWVIEMTQDFYSTNNLMRTKYILEGVRDLDKLLDMKLNTTFQDNVKIKAKYLFNVISFLLNK